MTVPGLSARPAPARPRIGVTLDAEPPGGYSAHPWYALRQNYAAAVAAAGGLPLALPHLPALAPGFLDALDGLIVTGGAFDIDPALYGASGRHPAVVLKEGRTAAEAALLEGAFARGMPVLGICGGAQLLAVLRGARLIQHIEDEVPGALAHEKSVPAGQAAHEVALVPATLLQRITGVARMRVTSSHHQAVAEAGPRLVVNARATDGVIEGIEDPGARFCLGVQWHPEYDADPADRLIFAAFVAACR